TEILQNAAFVAFQVRQLIHANHECRHRRLEREPLNVVRHFLYDLMQCLQFRLGGRLIADGKVAFRIVDELPKLPEQLVYAFNSAWVGGSSLPAKLASGSWKSFQSFPRSLYTPSMPLVFQGLLCSSGPKSISYMRRVSAPNCSAISSGFTTLYLDFHIFSTSWPQMYFPFSRIKSALAKSGLKRRNFSISSTSLLTMLTSTCRGTVVY